MTIKYFGLPAQRLTNNTFNQSGTHTQEIVINK